MGIRGIGGIGNRRGFSKGAPGSGFRIIISLLFGMISPGLGCACAAAGAGGGGGFRTTTGGWTLGGAILVQASFMKGK